MADQPSGESSGVFVVADAATPCPLLAQSRHELVHRTCPLSGVEQTSPLRHVCICGRYWG